MYGAGATRNEKAGNVALGIELKSVVNYVINLNFDGEVMHVCFEALSY